MTQDIIRVNIGAGASTGRMSQQVLGGKIIGIYCYNTLATADTFPVNVSLKDSGSLEILKLQSLKNFRSRECEFHSSYLPLDINGAQNLQIDVIATSPLSAAAEFQFILVYENTTPDNFTKQVPQAQSFANPASNWMAQKC